MKKLILLLTVVSTMWFTACGGDSSKETKELLHGDVQRSNRTIFLSKETEYREDGEVIDVTTYQYDSSNKLIALSYSGGECTSSYDTRNRLIEELCTYNHYGETTTSKDIYQYSGDKLVEANYYFDGDLEFQWRVTKWNGNKPVTVEWTDSKHGTYNWNISYTGDNPTHIDYEYSDGTKNTVDREYDNKETPIDEYSMFGGNYFWWYGGKNNVTREVTTSSYIYDDQTHTSKSVIRNEIIYNSHGLPTRIDTYKTHEENYEYSSHTYTTYEYR